MVPNRTVIINYSTYDKIMQYEKPKTRYNSVGHSLPNPDASTVLSVYIALKMAADGETGISRISVASLQEKTKISDPLKIRACIDILKSFDIIYYLSGGLSKTDKKYANQYIFPTEHWAEIYPEPDKYNDYIINPGKFLTGSDKKGESSKKRTSKKRASSEEKKITPVPTKIKSEKEGEKKMEEKIVSQLFESPQNEIYKLKNKGALDSLVSSTPLSHHWRKLSKLDQEAIKDIQKWLFDDKYYIDRYSIGRKEYGLSKEEVDWILKPVADKYVAEGGKL